MALIKRIVTGQTFGNWLDTTNKLIDDLNAANPTRGSNKLVRYDSVGSFGVRDLNANSWFLDRSSALRIDTISDTFLNPGHENDNTLFTAAATYAAIKAEAKNVIKNAAGHAVPQDYIELVGQDPSNPTLYKTSLTTDKALPSPYNGPVLRTVINDKELIRTTADETKFNQNVHITGDLSVDGESIELQTETLVVKDNNLVLNSGGVYDSAERAGFDIDKTNAFMRLVNSGNRFPFGLAAGETNRATVKFHELNEIRNFFIDKLVPDGGTSVLLKDAYASGEYTGSRENVRKLYINQKDELVLRYEFVDNGNGTSNTIPLAIGRSMGAGREATVLQPDPADNSSTANSEVTYNINGTFYDSYEEYKVDFLKTKYHTAGNFAEIVFSPKHHTQVVSDPSHDLYPGVDYFYWAGEVNAYSYVCDTNYLIGSDKQMDMDIVTDEDVATTLTGQKNTAFKLALGDKIQFKIDFGSLNPVANSNGDNVLEPFFIGTRPYTDSTRAAITNLVFDELGAAFTKDIVYQLNDTIYKYGGSGYGLDEYIKHFKAGTITHTDSTTEPIVTANVIFAPTSLGFVAQYDFYYFNLSEETITGYDYGGEIKVTANNTGLGEEIRVIYPMGLEFNRSVEVDATHVIVGGVPGAAEEMDAGDTMIFDLTDFLGGTEALEIKLGTTSLNYRDHGLKYEADGNYYNNYSDFKATLATASTASATFTPREILESQSLTYNIPGSGLTGGTIDIKAKKPKNLNAFHIATHDSTATIENPMGFNVTKNHNPILKMNGVIADFSGTQSGIRLPIESIDRKDGHEAAKPGTIRYNAGTKLFEGYTNDTWRGLGGVIDLNQDTQIFAHDEEDILHFDTSGFRVSNMQKDQYFLHSTANTTGLAGHSGEIKVESNIEIGKYSIKALGSAPSSNHTHFYDDLADSDNQSLKFTIQPNGVDIDSTGFLTLPVGKKDQRPAAPKHGMFRLAKDALQLNETHNTTGTGQIKTVDALEYYDGTQSQWITLTSVQNEFSYQVVAATETIITFKNILRPFYINEIDVFINGIRIPKVDYTCPSNTDTGTQMYGGNPVGPFYDCQLEFSSPRSKGQVITVIQKPARQIGATEFDFLSKSSLDAGLTTPVNFADLVRITSGESAKSYDTGALIVTGGIGVSSDVVVGGSVVELSASAYKENVKPISSALDKVKQLNGVEFTWKDTNKNSEFSEYGLIAENVADVVPNLVSYEKQQASGVKYSKVVALLIEAVKQQQEEIESLKQQLPKKRTRKTSSQK